MGGTGLVGTGVGTGVGVGATAISAGIGVAVGADGGDDGGGVALVAQPAATASRRSQMSFFTG